MNFFEYGFDETNIFPLYLQFIARNLDPDLFSTLPEELLEEVELAASVIEAFKQRKNDESYKFTLSKDERAMEMEMEM
jgi:hypothetical protein